MNPDLQLLISVWDSMKNYVQKKDKIEAAEHLVRVFDEECDMNGIEDEAHTFDGALKTAVVGHYGFGEDEDADYDEEWD
tara:strand:+ start:290 stop:526 length:237 start_codon:yes stop_codon:yes gene_type:complete